jgi:hypothetical protein
MYMQILLALFNSLDYVSNVIGSYSHIRVPDHQLFQFYYYIPRIRSKLTLSLVTMFRLESVCTRKYENWKSRARFLKSVLGAECYFPGAHSENGGFYYYMYIYRFLSALFTFLWFTLRFTRCLIKYTGCFNTEFNILGSDSLGYCGIKCSYKHVARSEDSRDRDA